MYFICRASPDMAWCSLDSAANSLPKPSPVPPNASTCLREFRTAIFPAARSCAALRSCSRCSITACAICCSAPPGVSARLDQIAVMNAGVALEILRYRFPSHVLDMQLRQRGEIQLETREIRREQQAPALAQQAQRAADHADVIALHVENAVHAF